MYIFASRVDPNARILRDFYTQRYTAAINENLPVRNTFYSCCWDSRPATSHTPASPTHVFTQFYIYIYIYILLLFFLPQFHILQSFI